MSNEDILRNGHKAEQLLNEEVFVSALQQLQDTQIWIFKSSKAEETSKRESAWAMIQAIDNLRLEIKKMVDNGKMAAKQLERLQKSTA